MTAYDCPADFLRTSRDDDEADERRQSEQDEGGGEPYAELVVTSAP
jgi:hypothetical protein